ncbi:hypothetical protein GCM10017708_38400 [Arthrobacter citreus]
MQYLSVYRDAEAAVMRTLSYVDGIALARRALAPAHFATGLRDTVCPPSTVFAAFNAYGEHSDTNVSRRIEIYPFNHHEGGDAVNTRRSSTGLPAWPHSGASRSTRLHLNFREARESCESSEEGQNGKRRPGP